MSKQINQVEIENVIREVLREEVLEVSFESDVWIQMNYMKSDVARIHLSEIKRRLGDLGYKVGLCTFESYGEPGMYASNSVNSITFVINI
mgnify:CR=1 FL=1